MMRSDIPTLVPYGHGHVPLLGFEPNQNDVCPYCSRRLDWYPETDDSGRTYMQFSSHVFQDANGVNWCNEGCAILADLDQRDFLVEKIREFADFELPGLRDQCVHQLIAFSRAFDQIEDLVKEAF